MTERAVEDVVVAWYPPGVRTPLACVMALFFGGACGAIAVLEDDAGAGGAGTTTATGPTTKAGAGPTTASKSVGVTTGGVCDGLAEELETAIDHARACSPLRPVVQCDGSAILLDLCGCPSVVANEHLPVEIQQAQDAYDAWVSAGCGPYPCESCTPAEGGFCLAEGDGSKGRCEAVGPD